MHPASIITLTLLALASRASAQCFECSQAPARTIWCDDFEDGVPLTQKYFEVDDNSGDFAVLPVIGRDGTHGARVRWQKGEIGAGGLKKSFGRTPQAYIGRHAAFPDSSFTDVYWRMDVRMQPGWTGGGAAKLSRALVLANNNWATGLMAHLWSGGAGDRYLGMDPASGVSAQGMLVSTKYNDFTNLRWLGFKAGGTDLFSDANAGRWYCVEGHAKLNTPGTSDGVFEFWINDTLQAGSYALNWHGVYNSDPARMTINAIFFENYWNAGSPVEQERYFDNLVIAAERIGCACGTSGADQVATPDEFTLWPNPSTGVFSIRTPGRAVLDIAVYTVLGERIHQSSGGGASPRDIDISAHPAGVYLVTTADATGLRRMLRAVKR